MSGAAHDYVRACTHPQVKGPTRAVFDAIAHFVPEGETTTPLIAMKKDLAAQARVHRRTVVTHLGVLVEIGEVKVIDGGQGRPARYQIVHLDGPQPIVATPLPLRADLQPVPPRARPSLPEDTTGDLFAPPVEPARGEERAINLWSRITSWLAYLCTAITSTAQLVIGKHKFGSVLVIGDHKLTSHGDELVIGTCDPDAVLTTARDVQQLKERTTTTTAPPADPPRPRAVESPPCRWFGTSHAWCLGRVHVPTAFHVEERRKLAREPGETDADLDARLFARYAEILAMIPDAADIPDKNEFAFWKRLLRSPPTSASATVHASVKPHRFSGAAPGSISCEHEPPCLTRHACIDRTLADGRAARERKSG